MSQSPEFASAQWRRTGVTTVLLIVLSGLIVWAVVWGEESLVRRAPPPISKPTSAAAGFADASENRVFLTRSDRKQAVARGLLPAGTRSILATGGKLEFGEWRWDDRAVPSGPITVRVDLDRQLVSVFQGPDEIGTAVIVYGMDGKETPRGKLPIRGKARDYHSVTYDAPMPFSLWLREDGVALHGSSVSTGKATNGCIGVPVEFAERLFEVAEKGDVIEVIG